MTRVIAVDPRSQGASTKALEGNTPESRAKDLHDVLTGMGISHSVLVGWSQGAQDVAAYLQEFGTDSVAGIVFVDTALSAGPAEIEIYPQFSKIILSGISTYTSHPEEFSEGMVHSLFKKPHPDLDIQQIVQFTLQTPTGVGIAMLVSDIFGADRRPVLSKLDRPALVIGSAESPFIDAEKEMAAAIPGGKFVTLEGTGHAVFVDEPVKFDDALRAFLQTLRQW
jgi:microsomal epoxide hydrolase